MLARRVAAFVGIGFGGGTRERGKESSFDGFAPKKKKRSRRVFFGRTNLVLFLNNLGFFTRFRVYSADRVSACLFLNQMLP